MQPLFFTVGADIPLMIIPDSQAHVDGHPVLTYTYSIYRNEHEDDDNAASKKSDLHLSKNNDPDYLGFITFEQPGKLFTYTSGAHAELSSSEVEEIIKVISHYRDTPALWSI